MNKTRKYQKMNLRAESPCPLMPLRPGIFMLTAQPVERLVFRLTQ